uniref:Uncharacterized protein n=1 Tax=Rhizophora mucronata TaxID=61149 RepID=A0A2P2R1K8_RHIMU
MIKFLAPFKNWNF